MNMISKVILGAVVIAFLSCLWFILTQKNSGNSGCSGNCAGCASKCSHPIRPQDKEQA